MNKANKQEASTPCNDDNTNVTRQIGSKQVEARTQYDDGGVSTNKANK
jgi:hypothetical protein